MIEPSLMRRNATSEINLFLVLFRVLRTTLPGHTVPRDEASDCDDASDAQQRDVLRLLGETALGIREDILRPARVSI
jgi:hypothetical protein